MATVGFKGLIPAFVWCIRSQLAYGSALVNKTCYVAVYEVASWARAHAST